MTPSATTNKTAKASIRRADMASEKVRFGFIDYFVFGELRRITVEFFEAPLGTMAWLDGEIIESRLSVLVTPEMKPAFIGDFSAVMRSYPNESSQLFAHPRMWKECIQHGAGLLLLFSVMETMRTTGMPVAAAVDAAVHASADIRESENLAIGEILGMFSSPDFFTVSDRPITIHPRIANESIFQLA